MGIGKAQRRRAKNAETANVSLHKAARGKGTVHMPLPAAPSKDDYKDKMPRSLRMMLALKEADQQPAKRRKLEAGHAMQQQQQQQRHPGQGGKQGGSEPGTEQQQPSTQKHKQQQQPQQQADAGPAWQQPKRLKQKKKEYLNAKKLKKKGKGRPAAAADTELLQSDRPAFGEVVHAPPEVALKSKHWAVSGSSSVKQQQQHHQQPVAATNSKKRKKQQQSPQQHAKQRAPKQPQLQDEEMLEMRQQLIETYRAGRPAPSEGQATLQTLKALVKKQQSAAARVD